MKCDAGPFALGPVGGSGPALLCLHGLTGTPYEVRPPAEIHAELGFACVGPLLPGHGGDWQDLARTPREAWVECALEHFDRLASTHCRVYVSGLSLGGVLALRLAQSRPVAGVLLLAAPIELAPFLRLLVPVVSRVYGSVAKTPAIADPVARERHPGLRRMPLRAVVQLMRLQSEVKSSLHTVRAPLRLLYSRQDPTVSVTNAEKIVRASTGTTAEVEYLERSGHVITVDLERDRVDRWLVRTLAELEKSPG